MRNCFVPHCDAFCKMNGITKRMMFSAPKNNFDAWKRTLFYKREFRETDRVCERHFDKNQIITHWDHVIKGEICKLERDKPKLKPLAVPYLNLPEKQNDAAANTNKSRTKRVKLEPKTREILNNTAAKKSNNNKLPKQENEDFELEIAPAADIKSVTPTASPHKLSADKKCEIFDSVYDDVYEIVLPSTLWGIHRDPDERQFIAFSKFDASKMSCSRVLIVNNKFEMKFLTDGVQTKASILDEISVEVITNLLNQLDECESIGAKSK